MPLPCSSFAFHGTHVGAQRLDLVEDGGGDRFLGPERDVALAVRGDDSDLVVGRVEADLRARDVVDDDRIEPLALELRPAPPPPPPGGAARPPGVCPGSPAPASVASTSSVGSSASARPSRPLFEIL